VVDMRRELEDGWKSMVSRPLFAALEALKWGEGEQALLIMNRHCSAGTVARRNHALRVNGHSSCTVQGRCSAATGAGWLRSRSRAALRATVHGFARSVVGPSALRAK
jgi:hypothetical protein